MINKVNLFAVMSTNISVFNRDPYPWIKHFEEQAETGGSSRSFTNKHYIVIKSNGVFSKDQREVNDKNLMKTKYNNSKSLPPIISPIKQSIDQAREELNREKEELTHVKKNTVVKKREKTGDSKKKNKSACKKQKVTNYSRVGLSDIFSFNNE